MRLIEGRTFYKEPWYGSYRSMMDRCYRKKAKNYPCYGGRGIKVCVEWHNIDAFGKWAVLSGFQLMRTNYCNKSSLIMTWIMVKH